MSGNHYSQDNTTSGLAQPLNDVLPAFLGLLWRGGAAAHYWTPDKVSQWVDAGNPPEPATKRNVYFSVHPGTRRKGAHERTTIADVACVNCLFAEFDAKDFVRQEELDPAEVAALAAAIAEAQPELSPAKIQEAAIQDAKKAEAARNPVPYKARIRAHIAGLAVAPSVIIDSGGGYHCYWLLRAPFTFAQQADRERARLLQKNWVAYVGGDDGAKDLARVLRLPGSLNCKPEYGQPRPVTFVAANLERLYNFPDLEALARPPERVMETSWRSNDGNGRGPSEDCGQYWLDKALAQAHVGNRDDTGFWLACQLRDAGLPIGEAEGWLLAYARLVPKSSKPGNDYGDGDALNNLESAYKGQKRGPAKSLTPRATPQRSAPARGDSTQFDAPTPAPEEPDWLGEAPPPAQPPAAPGNDAKTKKPPVPTDDELAHRWLAVHPDTAWGLGEFRRYDAGIWPVIALDVIRNEILDVLEGAKVDGVRPTARLLNSVMELARVKIAQPPEVWDANHDILICGNGALHIPTRTLQPHDKRHYATSRLAYDYDPAATAEVWEYVLNCCAPDAKEFLQEFAGYALTTDTKYETAVWLAGQPGGGKSTVLEGLRAMLSTRVCLLGLADIEKSRFALTNLPGKTLAISTEQPGGYVTASQALNAIISGEPITVERKFRDPVIVIPRAKLAWALNELPRVGSEGVGLFRRVKVLNFPPIPEAQRDPNIKERVKLEGAGILNWALDGLARLRARGRFEIPRSVEEATAHFRETNDIPAVFVADCCLTGTNPDNGQPYKTPGGQLYKAYSDWCKDNGHKPASSTSIAEDWRRLGFVRYMAKGKPWWRYVGLVETSAEVSTRGMTE